MIMGKRTSSLFPSLGGYTVWAGLDLPHLPPEAGVSPDPPKIPTRLMPDSYILPIKPSIRLCKSIHWLLQLDTIERN